MAAIPAQIDQIHVDRPLEGFSDCHAGILSRLESFAELPGLADAVARCRRVATRSLETFEEIVLAHHADEERELFPAVLRSARPGQEYQRAEAMVSRLTGEHRSIEAIWNKLKPSVKSAAAGKPVEVNWHSVDALVRAYTHHAAFEELEFLPLAREILGRDSNHMAALGLSLHLRHSPQPIGYI